MARDGWESDTPPGHQHCHSQRSLPLNILPVSCSLAFLQNQPVPFTAHGWQLEAEATSEPMAALRGGECISTMQF